MIESSMVGCRGGSISATADVSPALLLPARLLIQITAADPLIMCGLKSGCRINCRHRQ
jgi:hypothetical protein